MTLTEMSKTIALTHEQVWERYVAQHKRIEELEAHTPTQDAYDAACKALAHWRKEAKRLGKIAGVEPRKMKHT